MANATTMGVTPWRGQIRLASGVNVLLGIWLIIAPFVFAFTAAAFWNNVAVGVFVLLLAATRVSRPTASTKAASWTKAIIGIWLIIAPFVLDYLSLGEFWDDISVGVLLLILASWSASLPRGTTVTTTPAAGSMPADRPVSDRPRPPRDRI